MEKPARFKSKSKKPAAKPKATKKKNKSDGPSCSMFLAELTRKLASKKKEIEEEKTQSTNIIQTIIDSITCALPIKVSKKNSPQKLPSPMKMETLQSFAPELTCMDTLSFVPIINDLENDDVSMQETEILPEKPVGFKMPKMPVVSSEILKVALARNRKMLMRDQGVNTGKELFVAAEISRHVGTLRKISMIAEEFNKKTAKNLKEIVDSVQEDLIKKLAEVEEEQRYESENTFHVQRAAETEI